MQCELCHAELNEGSNVCPSCGAPVLQTVEGFPATMDIQRILRTVIIEHFQGETVNTRILTAVLMDSLTEYRRECRLLVYAIQSGVMKQLLSEQDRNIAVQRARNFLTQDCFIADMAAEFVLCCLTYMLKWPYEVQMPAEKPKAVSPAPKEEAPAEKETKKSRRVNLDEKVFRRVDAFRFRLSKKIELPSGCTKIEGFALDGYSFLQTLLLPDTLIAIEQFAFSGCKSLKFVALPQQLRIIGQGAFCQCASLTAVNIPAGVLEIAENTFMCCESLEMMAIPDTVSSIGAQAFSGCESLKKVLIPQSVKFIGEDAFVNCPKLTIRCYENSYAHKYALNNSIPVETTAIGTELTES